MCHKVTAVQAIRSLHLSEVGIILPKDGSHLLLEGVEFVAEIFELRLDDGLLRKLLAEKLPHLVGLENGNFNGYHKPISRKEAIPWFSLLEASTKVN